MVIYMFLKVKKIKGKISNQPRVNRAALEQQQ